MSDSEDDKPLAARAAPAHKTAAAANGHSSVEDPVRRKAAQKAPIIDESDSEDDKPLGARAKPAAAKPPSRPRSAEAAANRNKTAQAAAKPVAVKDEPLSPPAVKKEPNTSSHKRQSGKDAKGGAEEKKKRVIVKKEYDMPGQTKDTPLAIEPLFKFYTSLREQKPDSDMAKKWCLIHGLLEREEAEEYVDEIKRKKGDLRSPSKASHGAAAARKRPAASAAKPPVPRPAPKPSAKQRVKEESDSEDDEEDFLPQRKRQKPSGPSQAAAGQQGAAPRARPASGGSRASSASGDRGAPNAKPRPATQKDKAFADGGLDPISDDSDDDIPIRKRMTKA